MNHNVNHRSNFEYLQKIVLKGHSIQSMLKDGKVYYAVGEMNGLIEQLNFLGRNLLDTIQAAQPEQSTDSTTS